MGTVAGASPQTGVFVRKYKDRRSATRPSNGGGVTSFFGSYTGKVTNIGDILGRYETLGLDMAGQDAFGDNIDIDLGMLSFSHVDVSVPGNSPLPVELRRELTRSTPTSGRMPGFGNWSLVVPRVTQDYLAPNGPQANRCSGPGVGGPDVTRIDQLADTMDATASALESDSTLVQYDENGNCGSSDNACTARGLPFIFLTDNYVSASDAKQESIIGHEGTHVAMGDDEYGPRGAEAAECAVSEGKCN